MYDFHNMKLVKSDENESEEDANATASFKEKCVQCIKGPANLVKTIVFIICTVVVIIQVTNCILKIRTPPITTFTHFDYNDTIHFPAVTFCKNPEYKHHALEKYNLYSHPRFTSTWALFPFHNTTIGDAWSDIVHKEGEVFIQLGLNGSRRNLKITPSLHFVNGMCYTITARGQITSANKETGYSVLLKHTQEDVDNCISTSPPGYNMYIHSPVDPFTELSLKQNNLMEHLYVNVGEEIEIKLVVSEYSKISGSSCKCSTNDSYSAAECAMRKQNAELVAEVGCAGPWMNVDHEHCSNYSSMRRLVVRYLNDQESLGLNYKECPRRCRSFLYNAYVVSRKTLTTWDDSTKSWKMKTGSDVLQTQIYIYFNSMVVTVFEEHYNYDWSLFLSDLGGTIGFLLGISVIGFIKLLGKSLRYLNPIFKSKQEINFNDTNAQQCPKLDSPDAYRRKYTNDFFI